MAIAPLQLIPRAFKTTGKTYSFKTEGRVLISGSPEGMAKEFRSHASQNSAHRSVIKDYFLNLIDSATCEKEVKRQMTQAVKDPANAKKTAIHTMEASTTIKLEGTKEGFAREIDVQIKRAQKRGVSDNSVKDYFIDLIKKSDLDSKDKKELLEIPVLKERLNDNFVTKMVNSGMQTVRTVTKMIKSGMQKVRTVTNAVGRFFKRTASALGSFFGAGAKKHSITVMADISTKCTKEGFRKLVVAKGATPEAKKEVAGIIQKSDLSKEVKKELVDYISIINSKTPASNDSRVFNFKSQTEVEIKGTKEEIRKWIRNKAKEAYSSGSEEEIAIFNNLCKKIATAQRFSPAHS
ncbi:MAG: hypothetical protein ACI4CY_07460 [Candidatus Gastranaerophilaceae bacterium]